MRVRVRKHLRRRVKPRESLVSLGEASMIEGARIPPGVSAKAMLRLVQPGRAEGKAIMKFDNEAYRESIASTIDDLLGWGLVPKTTVRIIDGHVGSAQEWARGKVGWDADDSKVPRMEWMRMAAFDVIIGNRDRHPGNYLVKTDGKLVAIDHGYSLDYAGGGRDFQPFNRAAIDRVGGEEIPQSLMDDLVNLDEGDLRAALAPLPDYVVENVVWRWKRLIEFGHFPNWTGAGNKSWQAGIFFAAPPKYAKGKKPERRT